MSNNLNLNKYQSKSLQEYYIKFIEIKDPYIGNGWGWFVDLELNNLPKSKPIQIIQKYKSSHLKTIKEYPSIRSMKSITNLHQLNNQQNNQLNNQQNNQQNFYNYTTFICINLIGIIMFTMIYNIID
jgi:hypothetical protein